MELTWVAILASVAMGLAAVCIFIFAVKKDYFRNIEDAKYQVFWSDLEELVESPTEPPPGGPSSRANSGRLAKDVSVPKEDPHAGGSPKSQ